MLTAVEYGFISCLLDEYLPAALGARNIKRARLLLDKLTFGVI